MGGVRLTWRAGDVTVIQARPSCAFTQVLVRAGSMRTDIDVSPSKDVMSWSIGKLWSGIWAAHY